MHRLTLLLVFVGILGCAPRVPVLPAPTGESEVPDAGPHWTVEVYSGDDLARAEEIGSAVRLRFDDPVTVEAIGGAHHVRVGDFRTKEEATEFAGVVRESGYRSARAVSVAAGAAPQP